MQTVVFATSSKVYFLDDLQMSIDIPSKYNVVTRNIDVGSSKRLLYGFDGKALLNQMKAGNIYLDAIDESTASEIVVMMVPNDIKNFNQIDNTKLAKLAASVKNMFEEKLGITIEKYDFYLHDQAKFMRLYFNLLNNGERIHCLQYYTVFDNRAITIKINSYSRAISSEQEAELKAIIDTIHFNETSDSSASSYEAKSFIYKDIETGVEFTVPANWIQLPLSQHREFIDAKFISNNNFGIVMLYGSADIWSKMSPSEKIGLTRSDINTSKLTLKDIQRWFTDKATKNMFNLADSTLVSYGGIDYYKCNFSYSSEIQGTMFEGKSTNLLTMENGYLYTFQFFGSDENTYYKDFESLLASVKYPVVNSASANNSPVNSTSVNKTTTPSAENMGSFWTDLLLSLLISFTIYSAPIFVYRYAINKQPVEKRKAKKIVIIYGIFAFVVMICLIAVLNGGKVSPSAILIWSYVNYKILT